MVKICLVGACGRMGKELTEMILQSPDLQLVGAVETPQHPDLGHSIVPQTSVFVTGDLEKAAQHADVIVDFSSPTHVPHVLSTASLLRKAVVCGVTGLEAKTKEEMAETARLIPLFYSANMSLGIAVLRQAVTRVARSLGEDYDVEIQEIHHRNKKDAPSGTALMLGEAVAEAKGWSSDKTFCLNRAGISEPRPCQQIGFSALRGGGVSGFHQVFFLGDQETVTLSHESFSRKVFAEGALKAARWLVGQPAGLYDMSDLFSQIDS